MVYVSTTSPENLKNDPKTLDTLHSIVKL